MTHNTKEVVKKKKIIKKAIKKNNVINLILTLNYYTGAVIRIKVKNN